MAIKVDSMNNVSDIMTKPLVGEAFFKHRATVLGLQFRVSEDRS